MYNILSPCVIYQTLLVKTTVSSIELYTDRIKNMSKQETEGLEQWDLTNRNSAYLDRHMMFPLLEYLDGLIEATRISYLSKDVAAARLALLRPTHMVDYAIDTYKSVHGESADIPEEMEKQKTEVFKQLEELEHGCKPLTELCDNEEEKVNGIARQQLICVLCLYVLLASLGPHYMFSFLSCFLNLNLLLPPQDQIDVGRSMEYCSPIPKN